MPSYITAVVVGLLFPRGWMPRLLRPPSAAGGRREPLDQPCVLPALSSWCGRATPLLPHSAAPPPQPACPPIGIRMCCPLRTTDLPSTDVEPAVALRGTCAPRCWLPPLPFPSCIVCPALPTLACTSAPAAHDHDSRCAARPRGSSPFPSFHITCMLHTACSEPPHGRASRPHRVPRPVEGFSAARHRGLPRNSVAG